MVKPERLTVFLLSVDCLSTLAIAMSIASPANETSFGREVLLLLGLSLPLAIYFHFTSSMLVAAFSQGIRGVALVIIMLILDGRNPAIAMALTLPYLWDSGYRCNWLAQGFFSVTLIFAPLAVHWLAGSLSWNWSDAALVMVSSSSAVLTGIFSHQREQLVAAMAHNKTLKESVTNLNDSNVLIQTYADSASTESELRERNRITREMHDSVGYSLTNITMMARATKVLLKVKPDELPEYLDRICEQSEAAHAEARKILHNLRDLDMPVPQGLKALKRVAETFSSATQIPVSFSFATFPNSCGEEIDSALFRFVQEGLTNAVRHGTPSRISIVAQKTPEEISVSISDNGIAQESDATDGIGMKGMRERFAPFAGTVEGVGRHWGYELSVRIPIHGGVGGKS